MQVQWQVVTLSRSTEESVFTKGLTIKYGETQITWACSCQVTFTPRPECAEGEFSLAREEVAWCWSSSSDDFRSEPTASHRQDPDLLLPTLLSPLAEPGQGQRMQKLTDTVQAGLLQAQRKMEDMCPATDPHPKAEIIH